MNDFRFVHFLSKFKFELVSIFLSRKWCTFLLFFTLSIFFFCYSFNEVCEHTRTHNRNYIYFFLFQNSSKGLSEWTKKIKIFMILAVYRLASLFYEIHFSLLLQVFILNVLSQNVCVCVWNENLQLIHYTVASQSFLNLMWPFLILFIVPLLLPSFLLSLKRSLSLSLSSA